MRLTDLLSESTILVPLEGGTKEQVIRALVDLLYPDLEQGARATVLESILEREKLMSTGIGDGIALPHGTAPRGAELAVALGIPPRPVEFDAIDGQPVELVFLVLSDDRDLTPKMRTLARISRLLHRAGFRHELTRCTSAAEAMQVIVDEESRYRI